MNNSSALYSLKGKRVWVAGHRGMVGSALLRRLAKEDCTLLTVGREVVDLTQQQQVTAWMKQDAAASHLSCRRKSRRHCGE